MTTTESLISKLAVAQPGAPKQRLYKSAVRSMKMATPGNMDQGIPSKPIVFVAGIFFTDDEEIISYLDNCVKHNVPGLISDPNELYLDPEKYDPLLKMRNELRAELLAEMAENARGDKDFGNSVAGNLNAASTKNIAPQAAGHGITFQSVKK